MQNTCQKKKIIIDGQFKSLLPALDKKTFEQLEANILENGCRDALVLWNDIIIDGHNRYAICEKHDLPYKTVNMEFNSREEVIIWIIQTQVSRRNLSPIQLSYYRGLHYRAEKAIIKNKSGKNQYYEVNYQNDSKPQNNCSTAELLAESYKVSPMTIYRDAKSSEAIDAVGEASPEAKRKILSGESNINKKELENLSAGSKEIIEETAGKIAGDEYEKAKPANEKIPIEAIFAGMKPLDSAIGRFSRNIDSELDKITADSEKAQLKTALRSYIKTFEALYKRI